MTSNCCPSANARIWRVFHKAWASVAFSSLSDLMCILVIMVCVFYFRFSLYKNSECLVFKCMSHTLCALCPCWWSQLPPQYLLWVPVALHVARASLAQPGSLQLWACLLPAWPLLLRMLVWTDWLIFLMHVSSSAVKLLAPLTVLIWQSTLLSLALAYLTSW